jgi:signal transduction histidine kinase
MILVRVAGQRQRLHQHAAWLERLEENLQFAMRNSNVRLFSQDAELRYTWVPNPLPAYSREQMLGVTDDHLFPPEEARAIKSVKRRALEEEREVRQELVIFRDGQPRNIRLMVVPTFTEIDGERRKTGVTCVSVDLTDLRTAISERDALVARQEESLAEAARAQANLESFTSLVAHDLMQPLTVIQGYSDILRRRLGTQAAEDQLSALNALARSVDQMKRLIDDLRDMAALEQGRFSIHRFDVDLVRLIQEVVSDYQSTTSEHQINCHAPEKLEGRIDPARVSQLVGNLLSNAIKFSPEGGDIDVVLREDGESCTIEIAVMGIGMEAEDAETLFEMFFRLERTRSIEGLGLGLYISKGIVDAHGGSIHVESEPGKGSRFVVTLPLEASPQQAKGPEPAAVEDTATRQ